MKPTYEELSKALLGLADDTDRTYQALRVGTTPVISIGQWGRLKTARELATKAIADIA